MKTRVYFLHPEATNPEPLSGSPSDLNWDEYFAVMLRMNPGTNFFATTETTDIWNGA